MREMTEAVSAAKFAIRRMQTLPLSGCATASAARNRRERLSRSSSHSKIGCIGSRTI